MFILQKCKEHDTNNIKTIRKINDDIFWYNKYIYKLLNSIISQ